MPVPMSKLKIGIVQQSNTADTKANKAKLAASISVLASGGADIIVLQELHNGLYFCQEENTSNFEQAETIPGESAQFYSELARRHRAVIVCSLFEKRCPGLYHNTAAVFDTDGSLAGIYRKMHIPDDPAYYEKFYFAPGDLGFEPIQTSKGRLGVLVCWDQWYPEAARLMALKGAEILIYPTAIGWESSDSEEEKSRQHQAWRISQRAHAVANGLHVVAVNRTGFEADPTGATAGIQFWGQSFVCGPQGEMIYQAPCCSDDAAVVEIDIARTEAVRQIWPFFRDRRIDAYAGIDKRYLARL
jgi:N-carbamoylputrescine amidase